LELNVTNSDVQGGWTGTGNINQNPLFVNPFGPDNIIGTLDDNLRLQAGSPCIDSGNSTDAPLTDIENNPRYDDPYIANTGIGDHPYFDMGAYEYVGLVTTTTTTPPTNIQLSLFHAIPSGKRITLQWQTESEIDNAGFNVYRSTAEEGEYRKINDSLIPTEGSATQGASYEYTDTGLRNGKTYYYKLEDVDLNGVNTIHEAANATPRWWYGIRK